MKTIAYYLLLPLVYGLSLLPFRILYFLSDGLFILLYRVWGYRKPIVNSNLHNSFPEKSEEEITLIQERFYRYFCDLILETIKTLTISPSVLRHRVKFGDMSAFRRHFEAGQSVIIVMGHLGNWELAGARFSQDHYHQLYVIYHPLRNVQVDRLLYYMRTRLGNRLYSMKETVRGMIANRAKVTATAFIADQTPSHKAVYWTTFLNQETGVFTGTAKIARKFNYPVIYVSVTRPRRGYYEVTSEELIPNPGEVEEDTISETHTQRLEADIKQHPHLWLWTHRRWKHKREK